MFFTTGAQLQAALNALPETKTGNFAGFDAFFYGQTYLTSQSYQGTLSPIEHFVQIGAARGNKPNATFDPVFYASSSADLTGKGFDAADLLIHFLRFGLDEGRVPNAALASFDGTAYLAANPDVATFVNANLAQFGGSATNGALAHYVKFGALEGRAAVGTSVSTGQPFSLTTGVDAGAAFTGGSGDDTFNALATTVVGQTVIAATTLGSADVIDGGAGIDTLNLLATAVSNTQLLGSVKNIENIIIVGSDNISSSQTAAQIAAVAAALAAVPIAQTAYDNAVAADNALAAANAALANATADVSAADAVVLAAQVAAQDAGATIGDVIAAAVATATFSNSAADNAVAQAIVDAAGASSPTLATVMAAAQLASLSFSDIFAQATVAQEDAANLASLADADLLLTALDTANANLLAAQAAGGSVVDASFFQGSTNIAVDGKVTTVNKVTLQSVEFNGGAALNNTVGYGATTTAGNVVLTGSNGNVFVAGATLATLNLSGSVLAANATTAGTVTLDDTTIGGTVKTLNLALTSAATVNVAGMDARTTINAADSTGALKIDVGNTLKSAETIIGGAGADTLVAEISLIAGYNPTVSGVETIALKFTNDGVYNASKTTGATTLNLSGNTNNANVTNLATSFTTLVTNATNGSNNIDLAYAAGTAGNLTWNIGKALADADVENGDLTLTNVGTLTINAVGTLAVGTSSVDHGGQDDIYVDKALTSLTLATSTKGVNLEIDDLYGRNEGGLDGLKTLTIAANAGDIHFYGISDSDTEDAAKNLETLNITAANGAEVDIQYIYAGGLLSSVNVSATGEDTTAIIYEIVAHGVGEDSYVSGGDVGTVNLSASGIGADATIDDLYADGSIGAVNITLGEGASTTAYLTAGYGYVFSEYAFGGIGAVTVTAAANAGQSYTYLEANDGVYSGDFSTIANIGNITISAGEGADYQVLEAEADGSIGNVAATYNNDVGNDGEDETNLLDLDAEGAVGTLSLTLGTDADATVNVVSNNDSIGASTIAIGTDASAKVLLFAAVAIGDVNATVASGGELSLGMSTLNDAAVAGGVTISGAGGADVRVGDLNGSIFAEIGTVDLSGLTGFANVSLSEVALGTTIKMGNGGSNVIGTAGNDTIILTSGTTGADFIGVQTGSIIDTVTGFNITNDDVDLTSVNLIAGGTYGAFAVSAKGIASGGTLAQFKTLVNGGSFTGAGSLAFFDTATNSLFVAYTDNNVDLSNDQIIQLVGVTAASVTALSGGLTDILGNIS
jgi:hypothetical protein